jgi:uncharacterized protein YhbP (UPF0306 family)
MEIQLVHPQYPSDKLTGIVINILKSVELCSMATVSSTGESYIHTAYFCFDAALNIYFISDPSTQHGQNIANNQTMAVAVFDTKQPWATPHRGLQIFGRCSMLGIVESARALSIHAVRFHAYRDYIKSLNPLELKALTFKFYVFRPDRVKIFDEPEFGEETFITAEIVRG